MSVGGSFLSFKIVYIRDFFKKRIFCNLSLEIKIKKYWYD